MPANRKLKNKYKVYTGRIFRLRNYQIIPGYDQPSANYSQKQFYLDKEKDLGSAVMVFDETNTRVCILRTNGSPCWIQKYFLLEEVTPPKESDNTKNAIADLCMINKKMREKQELTTEDFQKFDNAIVIFQAILDTDTNKLT